MEAIYVDLMQMSAPDSEINLGLTRTCVWSTPNQVIQI